MQRDFKVRHPFSGSVCAVYRVGVVRLWIHSDAAALISNAELMESIDSHLTESSCPHLDLR